MCKLEAVLGFALHVAEPVSGRKQVCNQVIAAISCKRQIAELVGRNEGAPQQALAGTDGLRPGNNAAPEDQVNARLEATQPALLREVQAELAEAKPFPVGAEMRSDEIAEPNVSEAPSVADAVLLRPLAYQEPERLVVVHDTVPQIGRSVSTWM